MCWNSAAYNLLQLVLPGSGCMSRAIGHPEDSLRVLIYRLYQWYTASHVADHLGAPIAVVNVGADADHAVRARIVGGSRLHGPRAAKATQDRYLDYWPRRGIRAVPYRGS